MQRRRFFRGSLSAISAISFAPYTDSLLTKLITPPGRGFKVAYGKDRFNEEMVLGKENTHKCKISGKDTNGVLYVVEQFDLKDFGPPLHIHPNQDEWFLVMEGDYLVKVGEETFRLTKGDSAFGPRAVPHTFLPIGEGPHRMILTYQPAGKMEAFFRNIKNPAYRESKDVNQRFLEHEIEIVGPRLKNE